MRQERNWTKVSNTLVFDTNLTAQEFRLLVALSSYDWSDREGKRKNRVWPAMQTLAEGLGVHRNSIGNWLKGLVRKGYIEKQSGRGCGGRWLSNTYVLTHRAQGHVQSETTVHNSDLDRAQADVQPCTTADVHEADERNRQTGKKDEERDVSPAVRIYKEETGKSLPPHWQQQVTQTVTNASLWEHVVREWLGNGHNPRNVLGMLDWYDNGGCPYERFDSRQPDINVEWIDGRRVKVIDPGGVSSRP